MTYDPYRLDDDLAPGPPPLNQPPPGWRPQAPARTGGRVVAIVLLSVAAVVLVAALTYALVLRPMLAR